MGRVGACGGSRSDRRRLQCRRRGMDADAITDHRLRPAQWSASLSSRPGGQRRDKPSTHGLSSVSHLRALKAWIRTSRSDGAVGSASTRARFGRRPLWRIPTARFQEDSSSCWRRSRGRGWRRLSRRVGGDVEIAPVLAACPPAGPPGLAHPRSCPGLGRSALPACRQGQPIDRPCSADRIQHQPSVH